MRFDDPLFPWARTVQESHVSGRVKELRSIVIWSEAQRGKEMIHDPLGWVSHLRCGPVWLHSPATLWNIMQLCLILPHNILVFSVIWHLHACLHAYTLFHSMLYIFAPSASSGQRLSFQHRFSWKPSPWDFGTQLELVQQKGKQNLTEIRCRMCQHAVHLSHRLPTCQLRGSILELRMFLENFQEVYGNEAIITSQLPRFSKPMSDKPFGRAFETI